MQKVIQIVNSQAKGWFIVCGLFLLTAIISNMIYGYHNISTFTIEILFDAAIFFGGGVGLLSIRRRINKL